MLEHAAVMHRTLLVIPCYNEARRLDARAIASLLADPEIDLLLVDDGSTDTTRVILDELAEQHPGRVRVLVLEQNGGKAEAVRSGLLAAIESGRASYVGYLDADLATSPTEMRRLVGVMRGGDAHVVLGSRVALLGRAIERSLVRHYLGRVFATFASMALRSSVYDTQCGAKLFRVTPALRDAVSERFLSRWAFDVELLGRLLIGSERAEPIAASSVWEEPLRAWRDVKGSKLDALQMSRTLLDLGRIERALDARRRAREKRGRSYG